MDAVVVIGANRGIGLEFTRQYLQDGCHVVATYRNESSLEALQHLKQKYPRHLALHPLEVTDLKEVEKLAQSVRKIDLLILNAGIKGYSVPYTRPPMNTAEELSLALSVNTEAPDHIIRSFYPILSNRKNACIAYMSSRVGQTSDNEGGGSHPYRISKAAGNALTWNWNIELMEDWKKKQPSRLADVPCAVAVCPGWVRTDMGGPRARLSVEESVTKMRKVIAEVRETKESNGLYMYDGKMCETYAIPKVLKEIFQAKELKNASFSRRIISFFTSGVS